MRKYIKNWEEVIEQHRQSGKSIEKFCKEIGIHPNTFYINRKKVSHSQESSPESSVVEIRPDLPERSAPIVIKTKKFIISIPKDFDDGQLKSVLKIIGELV